MILSRKFTMDDRLKAALAFMFASYVLVLLGLDRAVSSFLLPLGILGAFAAGAFYTLGATTPFSMVVLLELMSMGNAYAIAFFACLAATLVDLALFMAFREALEANAKKLLAHFRRRFSKQQHLMPLAGFFVFAMPLPDEAGLALMEMTSIRPLRLAAVIFSAKFITLLSLWALFGHPA